ncbi:MAG: hypothetical protein ACYTHK_00335 [Planctomycetota bacterium]|jgi:hypothetical protein
MTEDPVKLYVVVMAILVAVLGWVAHTSYDQASAFETAIQQAPNDAEKFRELSGSVQGLINQLKRSKLAGMDHITLVENAATTHLRGKRGIKRESPRRLKGQTGKELRWKVDISRKSRGGAGGPVSRNDVARFCRQVELDSRGILKVIEIDLRRYHGEGGSKAGSKAEIRDDLYTGFVVVGMRVVD